MLMDVSSVFDPTIEQTKFFFRDTVFFAWKKKPLYADTLPSSANLDG